MIRRFLSPLILSGLLLVAASLAAPASAQTIINGSFEDTPFIAPDGFGAYTSIPGWTALLAPPYLGVLEVQREAAGNNPGARQYTPYGEQYVELDSDLSSYIYQDVDTIANNSYTVTFSYSRRPNVADNGFGYEAVSNGNGSTLFNAMQPLTGSVGQTDWTNGSFTFVANSNSTRIAFFNANPQGDLVGAYLDNVAISAVPEPGEYAVAAMMMGGVGLGLLRGRRQRKAA